MGTVDQARPERAHDAGTSGRPATPTPRRRSRRFARELDRGMIGSVSHPDGTAEVVRELPLDAELVVMRRPIAGG